MTTDTLKKISPYVIIFGAAIYLYTAAIRFDFTVRPGRIGPDAWPKAILILTIMACAIEIIKTLFFGKGRKEVEGVLEIIEEKAAENHQEDLAGEPQATYPLLLIGGIVLTLAYVWFFNVLGFFVDTFLYIVLFILIGRYRRPWIVVISGMAGSLLFMFIFMRIVYLSLPIGYWPFSALSLVLMRIMGIK